MIFKLKPTEGPTDRSPQFENSRTYVRVDHQLTIKTRSWNGKSSSLFNAVRSNDSSDSSDSNDSKDSLPDHDGVQLVTTNIPDNIDSNDVKDSFPEGDGVSLITTNIPDSDEVGVFLLMTKSLDCFREMCFQRKHIFRNIHRPTREWAKSVSEPVNVASEQSNQSE